MAVRVPVTRKVRKVYSTSISTRGKPEPDEPETEVVIEYVENGDEDEGHRERVIWAENITYLAKERGIKLMDLAKDVDVTVSFFSRARKGDSRADAVVLSNIADRLGVSLDLLMKVDLSAMGESEKLIAKSLNKMVQDTVSEKIRWEKLSKYETRILGKDGTPMYPFMKIEDVEPEEKVSLCYKAPLAGEHDYVEISGDLYRAKMAEDIYLYVIPVQVDRECREENGYSHDSFAGIDIFFKVASGDIKPVCSTYHDTREEIVQKIIELLETIRTKEQQALLDPFTSELLTDYLSDKLTDRIDPPF